MTDANVHAAFVGSIPDYYERYLVSFYFEPFAIDLANRLKIQPCLRVVELACGTGVVTQRLLQVLDADARITATDLNDAMLTIARRKTGKDNRVSWQVADATALPFSDESFDAVICQFGWMFFPDKDRALREARRVLTARGQLVFNTWDRLEACPVAAEADAAIRAHFPTNPPTFYETPFSMHDPAAIRNLLKAAEFTNISIHNVSLRGARLTPAQAASGIVSGGAFATEILQRGGDVATVEAAVADRLAGRFGTDPFPSPMRALACTAVAATTEQT
ncbi:MAG: methyltransferase domain-containing protein [Candidatus Eremiobacteraeota bacterium]|nr:methyltransferase domain-containing protein [Candidatus Eremiobacteraeota bacterium]